MVCEKVVGISRSILTSYKFKLCKNRILGECLLISNLLGKALRMLVDTARLAVQFNMRSRS